MCFLATVTPGNSSHGQYKIGGACIYIHTYSTGEGTTCRVSTVSLIEFITVEQNYVQYWYPFFFTFFLVTCEVDLRRVLVVNYSFLIKKLSLKLLWSFPTVSSKLPFIFSNMILQKFFQKFIFQVSSRIL